MTRMMTMPQTGKSLQKFLRSCVDGPRLLAFGLAVILIDFLVLGPYSFYQEHDNGDAIFPTVSPLVDSIPQPGLFFHLGMAGTDRLATGHHGGAELFLYWLFPDWLGLTILTVLMIAIAGVYTYLLAKDVFHATPVWAALAGILAATLLGGGQLYNFSIALMPATLWYLEKLRQGTTRDINAWLGLAVITLLHSVTGHIHFLLIVVAPVVTVWMVLVFPTGRLKAWLAVMLAVVVPVALRGQDIAAAALNGALSHRAGQTRDLFFYPDTLLKALQRPAWVPVIVSVVAACLVFVWVRRRSLSGSRGTVGVEPVMWATIRLYSACVFLQSLIFVIPLIKPYLVVIIPLFESFQLSRVSAASPMLWALCLGAVGSLLTGANGKVCSYIEKLEDSSFMETCKSCFNLNAVALVLSVVFIVSVIVQDKIQHAQAWVRTGSFAFAFHSETLADLAEQIRTGETYWRAEPIRIEATRLQAYGIETLGGYFTLYPKRYHQYFLSLIEPLRTTSPSVYASIENLGSESFLFANKLDPNPALVDFADIDLLSLANVRFLVSKNPLSEPWLVPLREREVPWDTLSNIGKAKENVLANFTGFNDVYIYENPHAIRRFFRPLGLERMPNEDLVLEALRLRPLNELLRAVPVLEGDFADLELMPAQARPLHDGSVGRIQRGLDTYTVDVNYDIDGLLAGSVSYSPYWTAVWFGEDGTAHQLNVEPVYHAFLGVAVPAGRGFVRFFYDPPYGFRTPSLEPFETGLIE
jgi:hypothetical protein